LRDDNGQIVHWFSLDVDIDESKTITEELRQTRARLSRATQVATVAELSASIAHEINQPLAAVVANGHACQTWLSESPPNVERARATTEKIIRAGNSAAEVVQRIRALFKQAAFAMVPSSINDIVVAVLNVMVDELRDSGVNVETELAASLPTIMVDRVQIQQTVINLMHNAIEAMDGVTDRSKTLLVISRRAGLDIVIEVRDSGSGIADTTSIFDPFVTTRENGMGMGLAICRSIVEVHGGRLWASPNEGAGTIFSFTLPLHLNVVV
jgi:C4-dicarboxylate-specific signal transduction histidine kinase